MNKITFATLAAMLIPYQISSASPPTTEQKTELLAPSSSVYGQKIVDSAKKYLGVPYKYGGRTKDSLDCLGLIFLSYSSVYGFDWHKINPDTNQGIIDTSLLGRPVQGLEGVLFDQFNIAALEPGDVIYFLNQFESAQDPPLVRRDGKEYRVWHTGLYAGNNMIIHSFPGKGTILEPINDFETEMIFVTRK